MSTTAVRLLGATPLRFYHDEESRYSFMDKSTFVRCMSVHPSARMSHDPYLVIDNLLGTLGSRKQRIAPPVMTVSETKVDIVAIAVLPCYIVPARNGSNCANIRFLVLDLPNNQTVGILGMDYLKPAKADISMIPKQFAKYEEAWKWQTDYKFQN